MKSAGAQQETYLTTVQLKGNRKSVALGLKGTGFLAEHQRRMLSDSRQSRTLSQSEKLRLSSRTCHDGALLSAVAEVTAADTTATR